MSESKIETAKGMCVVDVTKFLMNRNNWSDDVAYAHFMGMELYKILWTRIQECILSRMIIFLNVVKLKKAEE